MSYLCWMIIKSAEFQCSNTRTDKLPAPELPEYAFIGRSNVGKSSLINMLVQRKGLAKTSQTPGKTQLINHFLINENWQLVDLPGYGYARTSKSNRGEWSKFISFYLRNRENLQCVFVLVDSRLDPQKIDIEFECDSELSNSLLLRVPGKCISPRDALQCEGTGEAFQVL